MPRYVGATGLSVVVPGGSTRTGSGATSENRLGARVRRVLLLAGLVFASLPAGSALAGTTVGRTGTPDFSFFGPAFEHAQNDAVMPTAGVVTNFRTRSSSCNFAGTGEYDFQVLRPLGGNLYQVLGDTGDQIDPCDGLLHSYSVDIPVKAGDVLGFYTPAGWQGVLSSSAGSENVNNNCKGCPPGGLETRSVCRSR